MKEEDISDSNTKFHDFLAEIFLSTRRFELKEDEEYVYLVMNVELENGATERRSWRTKKSQLSTIEKTINEALKVPDGVPETILYTGTSFEIPVKIASEHHIIGVRGLLHMPPLYDSTNDLEYQVGLLSEEYLFFILTKLKKKGLFDYAKREINRRLRLLHRAEETDTEDILELLKRNFLLPFRYTLKIRRRKGKDAVTPSNLEELGDAFLFNLAYNLDVAIIKVTTFEEVYRVQKFRRLRRSRVEELEPPRRKYISDLVYHYQMAVSTESPVLQFLSYYHVLEHFFQRVYLDDLLQMIQDEITNPGFSYKRRKDLQRLYSKIKKRIELENQNKTELEALTLTLQRFIDVTEIKNLISWYDPYLIEYYQNNEVKFSNGPKINWNEEKEHVIQMIAKRIYNTRNSIVHSKDLYKPNKGDLKKLPKYIPFKHDKELQREIPRLRFIAEEVIIKSSSQI